MSRAIHGPREIQIYNETMREKEEAARRKGGPIKARTPASSKLRSWRVIIQSVRWDDVDSLSPRPSISRWARGVDITPRNLDRRRGRADPFSDIVTRRPLDSLFAKTRTSLSSMRRIYAEGRAEALLRKLYS
jgi:hypothetical protein